MEIYHCRVGSHSISIKVFGKFMHSMISICARLRRNHALQIWDVEFSVSLGKDVKSIGVKNMRSTQWQKRSCIYFKFLVYCIRVSVMLESIIGKLRRNIGYSLSKLSR